MDYSAVVTGVTHPYVPPPPLDGEMGRLVAVEGLNAFDAAPDAGLDALARLAADRFDAPIALVSLVGGDRQWFAARVGLEACGTGRDVSFCAHAIASDAVFVVPDAACDPRFRLNPLVTAGPRIRFYAGAPLLTAEGRRIGALCVMDARPRPGLSPEDAAALELMAARAMGLLEERRARERGRIAAVLAATAGDPFVLADVENRILHWNAAAEAVFGWSAAEAVGQTLDLIIPPSHRVAHAAGMRRVAAGGASRLVGATVEVPALRRDGSEFPIELTLTLWPDRTTGGPAAVGALIRDVSERKERERRRARAQALLEVVSKGASVAAFVRQADEPAPAGPAPEPDASFEAAPPPTAARLSCARRLAIGVGADGPPDEPPPEGSRDRRLLHMATHDPLTGLPNRSAFSARLAAAVGSPEGGAVLCVDLDRFKAVNDLHGHLAGDTLLMMAAARLKRSAPASACPARLGGDEFAVVAPGLDAAGAAGLARAIVAALAEPYQLGPKVAHIGVSVGIAVAPRDGATTTEVMRAADMALYRAKRDGRGTFRFFEADMDRAAGERRALADELRAGLAAGEVTAAYQPVACVETGRVVAFEALARWRTPARGPVGPDLFVGVAEESGLIGELGLHMLRLAAREAAGWDPPLGVAVNLSPVQFLGHDLPGDVARVLDETGLDPARLELEITENVLIRDADRTLGLLHRLRGMGVRIALDDFGTGYSSLGYLQRFPFDRVKVDQSFIRAMGTSRRAMAVVRAVIGLGRGLDVPITAEGVETPEQLELLRREGCSHVQGWLIGRPEPIAAFERVVLAERGAVVRPVAA